MLLGGTHRCVVTVSGRSEVICREVVVVVCGVVVVGCVVAGGVVVGREAVNFLRGRVWNPD